MEETKKKEEEKIEFNLDEEVDKSRIVKEYSAIAKYEEERGRYSSYNLKMVVKIDGRNVPHVRDERLSERQHQFLIKYLQENKACGVDRYDGVFQIRENNETKKVFYCWVITFEDDYKAAFLVQRDERKYLESFIFKNNKAVK